VELASKDAARERLFFLAQSFRLIHYLQLLGETSLLCCREL